MSKAAKEGYVYCKACELYWPPGTSECAWCGGKTSAAPKPRKAAATETVAPENETLVDSDNETVGGDGNETVVTVEEETDAPA